jgi:CRISPR-associated protein Cmr6
MGRRADPPSASPLCPVRAAVAASVNAFRRDSSCHLGLAFSKYVDVWSDKWTLKDDAKRRFLQKVVDLNAAMRGGEGEALLAAARCRFNRLVDSLVRQQWIPQRTVVSTSWRLVSGLGISHPFETGFVFHHTLGVPFMPGSSVKGAARAWVRESWSDPEQAKAARVFGRRDSSGEVIFFDAFPTRWPELEIDILNPHYPAYYEGREPPADWLSPVPVYFVAIKARQPFELVVAARARRGGSEASTSLAAVAMKAVVEAATSAGLGGKSSVGYGYFDA